MTRRRHRIDRLDQAARLRELAGGRRRCSTTLAIVSGKGGVGKSNIAVNLSICLAARGMSVTLVDVDMGLANADLLMNLHARRTLSHVIAGTCAIEEVCVEGPGGIRFVFSAHSRLTIRHLSYNIGICRIAFTVDDIDKTYADLQKMDVQFVAPLHKIKGPDGAEIGVVCFKDPDGTILELISGM
ncbi:MAG: P-loop NTPase [Planctomycetes bacterium]|nr:P-loop NTPase [Planctomycetota bacterium]